MQPADYCLLWIQSMCMPSSDWASWVQALGSILAILAAAGTMLWQQQLATRAHLIDRHRDELDKVQAINGLLYRAQEMLKIGFEHSHNLADMTRYSETHKESTGPMPETVLEALTVIPSTYAPSPELHLHLLEAHKAFRQGTIQLQMMRNNLSYMDHSNLAWIGTSLKSDLIVVNRAYTAYFSRNIELRMRIEHSSGGRRGHKSLEKPIGDHVF